MFDVNQKFAVIDYETYSECDLLKTSSYEYACHPTTEILCVSWKIGTRAELIKWLSDPNRTKPRSWSPKAPWSEHRKDSAPERGEEYLRVIQDDTIIKVAHNALFEQAITRFVLPKMLKLAVRILKIHPKFFSCTSALACVYALPRKLEGACAVLELPFQKDSEGHKLMLKWCKPKKPSKKDPSTRYVKDFDRLVQYCDHDIYAEVGVFVTLPPLIMSERQLWVFDQIINFRGVHVDRDLVKKVLAMIAIEKKNLTAELKRITNGEVQTGGQTAEIKKWLSDNGCHLPNLQAETVENAIAGGLAEGVCKRVLQLRQHLNKNSLKKYSAFLSHTVSDSRVRFSLGFHAASTGRWNNTGVQLHNVPRGTLKVKDIEGREVDLAPYAAELIKNGADLEFIRSTFGDVMEVFVSILRTMMAATPGKELFVADFAAIEARVLFWIADHFDGCRAFAEGRKMYEEMAMEIYNIENILDVSKDQRFVGKESILGDGFGMGPKKFQAQCLKKGVEIPFALAKKSVKSYRDKNKPVVKLWGNLERAAISAVQNPKKTFKINHTEWFMQGKFLCVRLPSGRCLYYFKPQVKYEVPPWEKKKDDPKKKPVLYHWGSNSKTKKWELQKTWGGTLTENCVQACARDLMKDGMWRNEKAGYEIILTVHDEIIGEREIGKGNVEEFSNLMKTLPTWAKGCPVNVEGWKGPRYRK